MNKKILPSTTKKAQQRSDANLNAEIRNQTISNINIYKTASPEIKNNRISALDHEWDIERFVETNTALIVLFTSLLGIKKSICFLITGLAGFFMLQHALTGWCPFLKCIRKTGIRTSEEISNEKTVMKILRGDFDQKPDDAEEMLRITEL